MRKSTPLEIIQRIYKQRIGKQLETETTEGTKMHLLLLDVFMAGRDYDVMKTEFRETKTVSGSS